MEYLPAGSQHSRCVGETDTGASGKDTSTVLYEQLRRAPSIESIGTARNGGLGCARGWTAGCLSRGHNTGGLVGTSLDRGWKGARYWQTNPQISRPWRERREEAAVTLSPTLSRQRSASRPCSSCPVVRATTSSSYLVVSGSRSSLSPGLDTSGRHDPCFINRQTCLHCHKSYLACLLSSRINGSCEHCMLQPSDNSSSTSRKLVSFAGRTSIFRRLHV